VAAWPSSLPDPLLAGYQLVPVDPAIRTDMEFGAQRVRRRSAARNDRISLAWQLTDAQMAIFRAWYETDAQAAGGAAWFYVTLAVGDGGAMQKEARFDGAWQATRQGGRTWWVTAQVEVR